MGKERKRFIAEENVLVFQRHLVEKVDISQGSEQLSIKATKFPCRSDSFPSIESRNLRKIKLLWLGG